MPSIKSLTTITALLSIPVSSSLKASQILIGPSAESTYHFAGKPAVIASQPVGPNQLLTAACPDPGDKLLDCLVQLSPPPSSNQPAKQCNVRYSAETGWAIGQEFELKSLGGERALLAWSTLGEAEARLVLRAIDLRDCSHEDASVPYGEELGREFVGFHTVVYDGTYDVFFREASLCGPMMCGQTHGHDGRLINGPLASYLPAVYFEEKTYVCPARPGSSLLGHFLLSSKLRLISSQAGRVKELMDYPAGAIRIAFSCDNGLLGFCWLEHLDEMHVNCRQFDGRGDLVLRTRLELGYRSGAWMAMANLAQGGLQLQTTMCDEDSWCADNVDRLAFFAYKVRRDGMVEDVRVVRDVRCNSKLRTGVKEMADGEVWLKIVCEDKARDEARGNTFVRMISVCVGSKNFSYGLEDEKWGEE